jgi:hypothetical protein
MRVGAVDSSVMAAATAARVAQAMPAVAMAQAPAPASSASSSAVEGPSAESFLSGGVPASQALAMYTLRAQLESQGSMVAALTARAEP